MLLIKDHSLAEVILHALRIEVPDNDCLVKMLNAVLGITTDMGTELGLSNFQGAVDQIASTCIKHPDQVAPADGLQEDGLFPQHSAEDLDPGPDVQIRGARGELRPANFIFKIAMSFAGLIMTCSV